MKNQTSVKPEIMSYKSVVSSATPKRSIPEIGWKEGVKEGVFVQPMSSGKFCIYRTSNMTIKSGYKTYLSIEEMEVDFHLHRETQAY